MHHDSIWWFLRKHYLSQSPRSECLVGPKSWFASALHGLKRMDLNEVQINEIQVTRMPNNLHIQLKILTLMRNSLIMVAPSYSQTLCTSALSGHSTLCSVARGLPIATAQFRSLMAVPLAGTISLLNCGFLSLLLDLLRKHLKTILFVRDSTDWCRAHRWISEC